jgi:hypothetical protein
LDEDVNVLQVNLDAPNCLEKTGTRGDVGGTTPSFPAEAAHLCSDQLQFLQPTANQVHPGAHTG